MTYKAFEDWYREGNIKHVLLAIHNGELISPPFATQRCIDYNKIMRYNGSEISYIDTSLPPAVSKTNCVLDINGSSWFVPYGIYESNYNIVLELTKDFATVNHPIAALGKGQFYSGASNGVTGFSFPLGYENTQYGLYIEDNKPKLVPFEHSVEKAHMGTVYCNGKYWSMPRGDQPGYNKLASYDGKDFELYEIPVDLSVTRKFTDIIVKGNILYSLPYGEVAGLTEVVEFDTDTKAITLHKLNIPDFAKKFNSMVMVGDNIIGIPYGDESCNHSNYGIVFNTVTKESKSFDIGIGQGGKYRYRSAIEFNNNAVFFPAGSPQYPVIIVDGDGLIQNIVDFTYYLFGRPVIYQNKLHVLAYHIETEAHHMFVFDDKFSFKLIDL